MKKEEIRKSINNQIKINGFATVVNTFMDIGILNKSDYENWKNGKVPYLEKLKKEIVQCNNESGLNIELIINEEKAFGKSHYGNFENCKNYIVIMGNKKEKELDEKAGYYGEKIVLKVQELGLNTCWVALTYNKAEVPCQIKEDEKISISVELGGIQGLYIYAQYTI